MDEPIWLQIGISGPRGKQCERVNFEGQEVKDQGHEETEIRFAGLNIKHRSGPLGSSRFSISFIGMLSLASTFYRFLPSLKWGYLTNFAKPSSFNTVMLAQL